jgi:hypothetical protein
MDRDLGELASVASGTTHVMVHQSSGARDGSCVKNQEQYADTRRRERIE